jgi:drug/metabolite transporter (DMT)-like permease
MEKNRLKRMLSGVPLHTSSTGRGVLFICLFAVFWFAVEWIGNFAGVSSYQIVWTRFVIHLVWMVIIVAPYSGTRMVRTNRWGLQAARGMLMFGMATCFIVGRTVMPPRDVLAAFWVAPLLTMVLGPLLLKERLPLTYYLAALVAYGGVLLILHPDARMLSWSLVFPLGMATCFGVYQILTRMLRNENTMANLFYTAIFELIPLTLVVGYFWRWPSLKSLMAMTAIGIVGWFTLLVKEYALAIAPVGWIAPFIYVQPVLAVGFALLLGHSPSVTTAIGALTTLFALGALLYLNHRQAIPEAAYSG